MQANEEASRALRRAETTLTDLYASHGLIAGERGDAPCDPPPYPHLYLADVTAEAIALRLDQQPRGLIVALDELAALFGGMNQYKAKGNDRESYLAFYDAGPAKIDRKTSTPPTIKPRRVGNPGRSLSSGSLSWSMEIQFAILVWTSLSCVTPSFFND